MNKIKKAIIVFTILIIIVIILLISFLKRNILNNEENISNENSFDETMSQSNNSDFSIVKNNSEYYGVEKIIDDFCEHIKIVYNENYLDEDFSENDKLLYQKMILDMLNSKYKTEFNINENNLREHVVGAIENDYKINSMYYSTRKNNICIYLVYGKFENIADNYNFMIVVDLINNAYGVYLNDYILKYNYLERNVRELKIEDDNIQLNENNKYVSKDLSNQDMAQKYLNNYKEILFKDLEKAYNLLENKYREKRFENYNEFIEYYDLRKMYIQRCKLQEYKVSDKESYTQYICIDNYNNYYIFNVEGVMKYTVQLDEYTILQDEFMEEYRKATDEQKVQTNIETFFKMINTKDYKAAYNVLDDTFKKNKFPNLEEFKKYAQSNFFDNTNITKVEELTKSNSYYICTINTSSINSINTEIGKETFIVLLGNDMDYKLSFTVK